MQTKNECLSAGLADFIISFCKRMGIKNIDISNISLNTSLDLDLNIFDLDMDVFLHDFAERFDVDIKSFKWGHKPAYPDENDMSLIFCIFRSFFSYKKEWVKRICRKLYSPKVFVRDFEETIRNRSFSFSVESVAPNPAENFF